MASLDQRVGQLEVQISALLRRVQDLEAASLESRVSDLEIGLDSVATTIDDIQEELEEDDFTGEIEAKRFKS